MKETLRSVPPAAVAAAAPLLQRASAGVAALFKLVGSSETKYAEESEACVREIRQQLDASDSDTKLKGLRRALAAEAAAGNAEGSASGRQSLFFPDVLKNLETSDFELKRLVYLYLVEHSGSRPDLTLLAINGFRKDLFHRSHVVRAFALKALSSLQLLEILQLLLQSVRRAAVDTSPLVRKTAAHAAAKLCFLDPDLLPEVLQLLLQLLQDGEPAVLGAAAVSLRLLLHLHSQTSQTEGPPSQTQTCNDVSAENALLSDREFRQVETLSALHPLYRRLLAVLPQLQPAAQVALVDLLTRYCRAFFRKPRVRSPEGGAECTDGAGGEGAAASADCRKAEAVYDPLPEDYEAFRGGLLLLLHSDSAAVVTSACASLYALFPPKDWTPVVPALLRTLHATPPDCRGPLLEVVWEFSLVKPSLFAPHFRHFFLKQSDPRALRLSKLRLLLHLCQQSSASMRQAMLQAFLLELQEYVHWAGDAALTTASFGALKILAMRHPSAQPFCLRLFLQLLDSSSAAVASEAVVAVRTLLQHLQTGAQQRPQVGRLVLLLAAQLQRLKAPAARASVVWIVGRHHAGLGNAGEEGAATSGIAEDALRQLTKTFPSEGPEAKAQVLLLALRLWFFHRCTLQTLRDGASAGSGPGEGREAEEEGWRGVRSEASAEGTPVTVDSPQQPLAEEQRLMCLQQQRLLAEQEVCRRVEGMLGYLLKLASFDACVDVRDLARFYAKMKSLASTETAGALDEKDRDMRVFALKYLRSLAFPSGTEESEELRVPSSPADSHQTPLAETSPAPSEANLESRLWIASSSTAVCDEADLCFSLSADPTVAQSRRAAKASSLASSALPLPAFAKEDSEASLRVPPAEAALRLGGGGFQGSAFSPEASRDGRGSCGLPAQALSSADAAKNFCAAELMGRGPEGSRRVLTTQDLEAFLQTDFSDACLDGSSSPVPTSPSAARAPRGGACGGAFPEGGRREDCFEQNAKAFAPAGVSRSEEGSGKVWDLFNLDPSADCPKDRHLGAGGENFVFGEDAESDEGEGLAAQKRAEQGQGRGEEVATLQ